MKQATVALAVCLCLGGSGAAQAARYKATQLNSTSATPQTVVTGDFDVKGKPRFIGLDTAGRPTVWHSETGDYDTATAINLDTPNVNRSNFAVTDISDNTNSTSTIGSEMIVGSYLDIATNKRAAAYWTRNSASGYAATETLPPYQRSIPPCGPTPDGFPSSHPLAPHGSECYDPANPPQASDRCAAENLAGNYVPNGVPDNDPQTIENPLFVYDCDQAAEALGVNNNGIIIGVSYPDSSNTAQTRPVYWIREIDTANNELKYLRAYDLGVYRLDAALLESDFDDGDNTLFRRTYFGRPHAINKANGTANNDVVVAGVLDIAKNGKLKPTIWTTLAPDSHRGPSLLTDATGYTFTAVYPEVAAGWKELSASPQINSAKLFGFRGFDPAVFPFVQKEVEEFDVPAFTGNAPSGKVLSSNGGESVGTAKQDDGTFVASYFSDCRKGGLLENLNGLLTAPLAVTLTEALSIKGAASEGTLLARGDDGLGYVLTAETLALDIGIQVSVQHGTAHVGVNNVYSITLTNHSAPSATQNNWATCVRFTVRDFVYFAEDHARSLKQEPGGVDYLSVEPTGIWCDNTPVLVDCMIERLDPGESKTVTLKTRPREILTDRTVRTRVEISSREEKIDIPDDASVLTGTAQNNAAEVYYHVERDACFIATAAYGSLSHDYVEELRHFRDRHLLQTATGRWLVAQYYRLSPPIADFIRDSDLLRASVRMALVPVVLPMRQPWLWGVLLASLLLGWRLGRAH